MHNSRAVFPLRAGACGRKIRDLSCPRGERRRHQPARYLCAGPCPDPGGTGGAAAHIQASPVSLFSVYGVNRVADGLETVSGFPLPLRSAA